MAEQSDCTWIIPVTVCKTEGILSGTVCTAERIILGTEWTAKEIISGTVCTAGKLTQRPVNVHRDCMSSKVFLITRRFSRGHYPCTDAKNGRIWNDGNIVRKTIIWMAFRKNLYISG